MLDHSPYSIACKSLDPLKIKMLVTNKTQYSSDFVSTHNLTPAKIWLYNYVKINVDTRLDFKLTQNT